MIRVDWKRVGVRHGERFADQEADEIVADAGAECEDWFCDVAIGSAVEMGFVDEVIEPAQTRRVIAEVLLDTPGVRGLHGNIPL